ncbi:MAG: acetyl-CoA carboxylase biotin carboxyl carrier protein subunit [Clostridia bacterium]|nr:acetyl-CoA carboxylase biotin carboxyl carrier protein subunit [Clostridia bacterium]
MKKYNVTVNGVTYEVLVEESDTAAAPAPSAAPKAPAPKPAAPKAAPEAAPKAPAGGEGSIKVTAPMPGTILKMNVKVGDTVKASDLVCVLEAMKMENEIFAKEGGIVKTVDAPQGSSVNSGDTIITLG